MSRYLLNRIMWEVDQDDSTLASFKESPERFVDAWEPAVGTLESHERQALKRRDYGALYAMGSNPYLLWQFARSVSVPDEMTVEELIVDFREQVAPHPRPDFFT